MAANTSIRNLGELYTFARSGTVVDRQARTETTIHSTTTGGSTLLNDGVGPLSQPTTTVTSSTAEIVRMFLRDDKDAEFEVEVENLGFGVRPGHRLTVIYAGDRASQQGYPMAVANHTTNERAVLPHRVEWLIPRRSAGLGCAALAIIPFFAMLFGGVIERILSGPDPSGRSSTGILVGALALGFVGFKLLQGRQRNESLKRDIIEALQRQLSN